MIENDRNVQEYIKLIKNNIFIDKIILYKTQLVLYLMGFSLVFINNYTIYENNVKKNIEKILYDLILANKEFTIDNLEKIPLRSNLGKHYFTEFLKLDKDCFRKRVLIPKNIYINNDNEILYYWFIERYNDIVKYIQIYNHIMI